MAANSRDEVLKFVLETQGQEGLDALTKGLADAGKQGGESGAELTKLANDLAALLDRAKQVEALQALQDRLAGIDTKLAEARAQLAKFNAENDTSSAEFLTASKAVAALTDQHDRLAVRVSSAAAVLNAAGIDTTNLSKAHEELGAKATATAGHLATAAAAAERGGISFATLKEHVLGVGEYLKSGGERALEFGKHLLEVSGIAGVVAGAFATIKGFRFFEAGIEDAQALGGALKKLSAISGATGEDLNHLKEIAEEAARATSTSTVESVQALTQLTKSFGDVRKAAEVLPTALQFAKAAGIELSQSVDIVTTTMKAFNVSADQASHITDTLATVSRKTGADLGALSDSFGKLAPYASQAHISFDETAAALGALTQRGLSAEQSSRALIAIFGALDDPSSKLRQQLVGLGIDTYSFATILDGLKAAGDRGVQALEGMDKRAKPALLSLVQAGGAGLRDLSAAIEQSTGETKRLSDFMTSGFGTAVKNFKTHIDEIAGETVSGVFAPLNAEIRKLDSELLEASKNGALEKIKESITDLVKVGTEQLDRFVHTVDWPSFWKQISDGASSVRESIKNVTETASAMGRVFGGIGDVVGAVWNVVKVVFSSIESATSAVMSGITQSIGNSMALLGTFNDAAKQKAEEWYALAAQYAENSKKQWADGDAAADQAVKSLGNLVGRISETGTAAEQAAPKHEEHAKSIEKSADAAKDATGALEKHAEAAAMDVEATRSSGLANEDVAKQFLEAKATLDKVTAAYEALRASGTATATELAQAIADVDDARDAYNQLEKQMHESEAGFKSFLPSLDAVNRKLEETPPMAKAVEAAFKTLHITSQEELENTAIDAQNAFATIDYAADNTARGLADRRAAFLSYAKAALEASAQLDQGTKDSVQYQLESKASSLGLLDALRDLEGQGLKTGAAIAGGMNEAAQATRDAEAQARKYDDAMKTLRDTTASLEEKQKALAAAEESAGNAAEKAAVAAESVETRMRAAAGASVTLTSSMLEARQEFAGNEMALREFDRGMAVAAETAGTFSNYLEMLSNVTNQVRRDFPTAADEANNFKISLDRGASSAKNYTDNVDAAVKAQQQFAATSASKSNPLPAPAPGPASSSAAASSGVAVHLGSGAIQIQLAGPTKPLSGMSDQEVEQLGQRVVASIMPDLMHQIVYQFQLAKSRT